MTTYLPRLSLLAVPALALALAACGGESDPAPPSSSAPAGGNIQNNTATSTGPEAAATEADPAETDTGAGETDAGADAPAESQAGAGLEVRIVEFEYMPKDLKVKAGAKLTFTNEDTAAHTATADDRKTFRTKDLEKGDSDEVTLDTPGTFTYFCEFHVFMKGSVTVE